jgi:hypothetical protein
MADVVSSDCVRARWPPDQLGIGRKSQQFLPAQASCRDLGTTPELRIPNAAAQTRIVSKARIRLDFRKSVRSFKGIICVDISEFESYMPSHAVGLSGHPHSAREGSSSTACRGYADLEYNGVTWLIGRSM